MAGAASTDGGPSSTPSIEQTPAFRYTANEPACRTDRSHRRGRFSSSFSVLSSHPDRSVRIASAKADPIQETNRQGTPTARAGSKRGTAMRGGAVRFLIAALQQTRTS